MKVPLLIDPVYDDGIVRFGIWTNGKHIITDEIFKPYCYSYTPYNEIGVTPVKTDLKPLTDRFCDKPIYKLVFDDSYTYGKFRKEHDDLMESNINMHNRLLIDHPEICEQYANTEPLRYLDLDIETWTHNGKFPEPEREPIIAIGLGYSSGNTDGRIDILDVKKQTENPNDIELLRQEKELLKKFCDIVREFNPDIISTYNGNGFDINYIITRMKKHGLSTKLLTRDNTEITARYGEVEGKQVVKEWLIGGRKHYDILETSVFSFTQGKIIDQSLYADAPENYSLKTIAKLKGEHDVIKEAEEDIGNMWKQPGTEQLHTYLTSDIRCTRRLRKVYLPVIIAKAEFAFSDLGSMITGTTSYLGNLITPRGLHDKYVGDMSLNDWIEKNYPVLENKQGALIEQPGYGIYTEGIIDADAKSQYPSVLIGLNLSQETTRFLRIENKLEPYHVEVYDDKWILHIPDYVINKQLVIEVDRTVKGYLSTLLQETLDKRAEIRKRMKDYEKGSEEYVALDCQQQVMKLVANGQSGYLSTGTNIFAGMACYCAMTGTARAWIREMAYPDNAVLLISTDGVFLDESKLCG